MNLHEPSKERPTSKTIVSESIWDEFNFGSHYATVEYPYVNGIAESLQVFKKVLQYICNFYFMMSW